MTGLPSFLLLIIGLSSHFRSSLAQDNPYNNTIVNTPLSKFPSSCERICIRKEIHDLTMTELNKHHDAINWLHTQKRADGYSEFEKLAMIHSDMFHHCHGSPKFLVWHRFFLRYFEKLLQRYDPTICLPYWDEGREWANLSDSVVWKYYGFKQDANLCITDGKFGGMKLHPNVTGMSNRQCLWRNYAKPQGSDAPFFNSYAWNTYYGLIKSSLDPTQHGSKTPYHWFNDQLELHHTKLHWDVSGLMLLNKSPADPIFWAHHGFVDKIYSDWQNFMYLTDTDENMQFSGFIIEKDSVTGLNKTTTLSLDDIMWVDQESMQTRDAIDTKKLCYIYANPGEGRNVASQISRATGKILSGPNIQPGSTTLNMTTPISINSTQPELNSTVNTAVFVAPASLPLPPASTEMVRGPPELYLARELGGAHALDPNVFYDRNKIRNTSIANVNETMFTVKDSVHNQLNDLKATANIAHGIGTNATELADPPPGPASTLAPLPDGQVQAGSNGCAGGMMSRSILSYVAAFGASFVLLFAI